MLKPEGMVCPVSSWALPEESQYSRQPAGLHAGFPAGFDYDFDRQTVFYDCCRVSETKAVLVGPPLLHFSGILDSLRIQSAPSGRQAKLEVRHRFTTRFANQRVDNLSEIWVDVAAADTYLHLQCAAGEKDLEIQPAGTHFFRGKKALFTLSKDNDPQWICDWMRFHRDVQGANAVLLYDNASSAYSSRELEEKMRQVSGFEVVCVVSWPHKYGPRAAGRQVWDYAFSQVGVMEDARWRFLNDAYAVLNCDIDELVLSQEGNLFDRAAASVSGCLRFTGRWVTQAAPSAQATPRHRESTDQLRPLWRVAGLRLRDANLCPAKWVVVPGRCPPEAHWSVHEVVGKAAALLRQDDTCYRHFTRIGTNWKNNRHLIEGRASRKRKKDIALERAFARVHWDS